MMSVRSYQFDPCSIDGSDQDDVMDNIECKQDETIDSWKPSTKKESIPKSEWRKKQINGDYNQMPSIDDFNKIKMYLKKKFPDHEIMEAFGINSHVLSAIKDGRFCPAEGIAYSDIVKITKKFKLIDTRIEKAYEALRLMVEIFHPLTQTRKKYASLVNHKIRKKKTTNVE